MRGAVKEQYAPHARWSWPGWKKMDAYIALRGSANIFRDLRHFRRQCATGLQAMKPVQDRRVNIPNGSCCAGRPGMAQQAGMSTEYSRISISASARWTYRRMTPGMNAAAGPSCAAPNRVQLKGPGNGPEFLHQGHWREGMWRAAEYSRRRGLLVSGQGERRGGAAVQRPRFYLGTSFDQIRLSSSRAALSKPPPTIRGA